MAWFDNVPLFSYMLLRGRCRACGVGIPLRYPLVELLTCASFFCAVWFLGPTAAAMKFCVFAAIVITLMFSDLEERILPDEFTLGGAVAGVIFAAFPPLNLGIVRALFLRVENERLVSVGESLAGRPVLRRDIVAGGLLVRKAAASRRAWIRRRENGGHDRRVSGSTGRAPDADWWDRCWAR